MPSPNAPASFVVRGFDFDFAFEFPDSGPALEDQTGTKTLHGRAGCAAVAAASLCATLSTSASLVDDNAKRNGPLTTVMRASSRGSPAASAVEILRNVRSTCKRKNTTSSDELPVRKLKETHRRQHVLARSVRPATQARVPARHADTHAQQLHLHVRLGDSLLFLVADSPVAF